MWKVLIVPASSGTWPRLLPHALELRRQYITSKWASRILARDSSLTLPFLFHLRDAPIPRKSRSTNSGGIPRSVGGSSAPAVSTSSSEASSGDLSKAIRRGVFWELIQGTVDRSSGSFTPPTYTAGHKALLTQGDSALAAQDFIKVLAQALQDNKGSHDVVDSLVAVPKLNLSQWVAMLNGSFTLPASDDELFTTAGFAIQHLLPRDDLKYVPRRGESLLSVTKADTEREKEVAVGTHSSQLTSRSTRIVAVSNLASLHQLARGFANAYAIFRTGLEASSTECTLGNVFYNAAFAASDADAVREAKEQLADSPHILHSIQTSVIR